MKLQGVARWRRGLVVAAMLVIGLVACRSTLDSVRTATVPPDLSYIPPDQVKTAMWVLAAEVKHLEDLLDDTSTGDPTYRQSEVTRTLGRMSTALKSLDRPGRSTQHPMLNENLGRFVARLERAERAAKREPPNYFPASTIAGSCFFCHGPVGQAALPGASTTVVSAR